MFLKVSASALVALSLVYMNLVVGRLDSDIQLAAAAAFNAHASAAAVSATAMQPNQPQSTTASTNQSPAPSSASTTKQAVAVVPQLPSQASSVAQSVLACRSDYHFEKTTTGASQCVPNTSAGLKCELRCPAGQYASGPVDTCNQECLPNPTATTPTVQVGVSSPAVVEGSFDAPGGTETISWSVQNAPANSSVFLFLEPTDKNSKLLLAAQLPVTGSYAWQNVGPQCASDDCDLTQGGPGDYTILAELYTPSDACFGQICPTEKHVHADVIALSRSGTFTVVPSTLTSTQKPSSGGGGTSGGSGGSTGTSTGSTGGLVINVTFDASVANAPAGFTSAIQTVVQNLESRYTDPITLNLNVGYGEVGGLALSSGALAQSNTYLMVNTYAQLMNALVADAKTNYDSTAVSTLPPTDPIGAAGYYTSTAQAKALKLYTGTGVDGNVGFSSTYAWTYNNSAGVASGTYDFQGAATHEITEVLGRILMASPGNYNTALELFHYGGVGVRDTTGTQAGYFSYDNGNSKVNSFNTSTSGDFGDWSGATRDAFNAFATAGVILPVSEGDYEEMDVIGYDRTAVVQPKVGSITFSPSSGIVAVGSTTIITLNMTEAVTVTGGTPSLTLNDGGTATYIGGSGTSALTFSYTVAAGQNTGSLAATAVNLNGATIADSAGVAAYLALSGIPQSGPQIGTDTTPPTVPANLTGSAVSQSQINLTWSASSDNFGVAGYRVYRNGALVATTSNPSYNDAGLTASTTYTYAVAAYDAAGNTSNLSTSKNVTTLPPDTTAPSIVISSPAAGAKLKGTSVKISASASDTSGVASMTISIDGTLVQSCFATTSCSYTWALKGVVSGSHTIAVGATDGASNYGQKSITVTK